MFEFITVKHSHIVTILSLIFDANTFSADYESTVSYISLDKRKGVK